MQQTQQLATQELHYVQLRQMNIERQNRIIGLQVQYLADVEVLKESDCFSSLQNNEDKQLVSAHFPLIRRVRGDGNCLYSCLVYSYIEILIQQREFGGLISDLRNNPIICDIVWNKQILLSKEVAQMQLLRLLEQFQWLCGQEDDFQKLSQMLLYYINNINGIYDLLIIMIRSYAAYALHQYHNKEPYVHYMDGDVDNYRNRIITFEEEGDMMIINLLTEVLPIKVKIIQFEAKKAFQSMEQVDSKVNKLSILGTVYLKYLPEHYDILYSKLMREMNGNRVDVDIIQIKFEPLY